LMTILVDKSSSIGYSKLAASVRDGYNSLLDAVSSSREKDSILTALWTFNSSAAVVHAYVPIQDAQRLDRFNYQPSGSTALFDTWCDALAANVAYAQRLRDGGTPCRSVVVIITDGEDTASRRHAADCERLSRDLLRSEQFVLAFVGVGSEASFKRIAGSMGIPKGSVHVQTQVQATAIRQTFQLVSQSAIRASQGKILPGPQAGFFQP